MNKKTFMVIAVVVTCTFIASASAIISNYPLQQQTHSPITTPANIPNPSLSSTSKPTPTLSLASSAPSTPQSNPNQTNLPTTAATLTSATPTQASPLTTSLPVAPALTTTTPSPSSQSIETPTTSLTNLFNAELAYVYVGPTNSTGEGHDHFGFGIKTYPANYYPVTIVFKLTYLGNPENEPYDAKFEGFLVTLSADTGVTASYIGYFGANFDPSFSNLPLLPILQSSPHPSVSFRFNLTINESFQGMRISDGGSFGSAAGSIGLWNRGTPNTITVTVQRAGWVTIAGGSISTVANPANDVVLQQVQLEKSGDGFLFGSP